MGRNLYRPVRPTVWSDRGFRRLPVAAKLTRLYVATCEQGEAEGLFFFDVDVAAVHLGLDPDDVEAAMVALDDAGVLGWDPVHRLVLDPAALRSMRRITSEKDPRYTHARRQMETLPDDSPLIARWCEAADQFQRSLLHLLENEWPDFGADIDDTSRDRTAPHVTAPHRGPSEDQGTQGPEDPRTQGPSRDGQPEGHRRPTGGASDERCKAGAHEGACILDAETVDGDGRPVCLDHAPCVICGRLESEYTDPERRPVHAECAKDRLAADAERELGATPV